MNGVDALAVSRWELGKSAPRTENMVALAAATARDLAWFYSDHTERKAAVA